MLTYGKNVIKYEIEFQFQIRTEDVSLWKPRIRPDRVR